MTTLPKVVKLVGGEINLNDLAALVYEFLRRQLERDKAAGVPDDQRGIMSAMHVPLAKRDKATQQAWVWSVYYALTNMHAVEVEHDGDETFDGSIWAGPEQILGPNRF